MLFRAPLSLPSGIVGVSNICLLAGLLAVRRRVPAVLDVSLADCLLTKHTHEVKTFFLAYAADSQPTDTTKATCKRRFKSAQTSRANTSNLAKHLAGRHADLFMELKELQVS